MTILTNNSLILLQSNQRYLIKLMLQIVFKKVLIGSDLLFNCIKKTVIDFSSLLTDFYQLFLLSKTLQRNNFMKKASIKNFYVLMMQ